MKSNSVAVHSDASRGRHIVSQSLISPGTVIERIPVIVVPRDEVERLHGTLLFSYVFEWDPPERYKITKDLVQCDRRYQQGVALGLISLCNHSETPNSDYEFDYEGSLILWRAIRTIRPGEEVRLHYKVPIWFEMTEPEAPSAREAAAPGI